MKEALVRLVIHQFTEKAEELSVEERRRTMRELSRVLNGYYDKMRGEVTIKAP